MLSYEKHSLQFLSFGKGGIRFEGVLKVVISQSSNQSVYLQIKILKNVPFEWWALVHVGLNSAK